MLWYLGFVAALNLALGYMWATRTRSCPRCARQHAANLRASRLKRADEMVASPATAVATEPPLAPEPNEASKTSVQPQPAPVAPPTLDASPKPAAPPFPDATSVDWGETYERYFGGLSDYRGELSAVDKQLDEAKDNAEQVTECANRLQAANGKYIGVASDAIGQLAKEPINSLKKEAGQTKIRETLGGQIEMANRSNADIEALDVAADPGAARDTLQKTTKELHRSTEGLDDEVTACLSSMRTELGERSGAKEDDLPTKSSDRDPATGLATRAHAEFVIGQLSETAGENNPVTVALVEFAGTDAETEAEGETDQRLVSGVSNILRQSLSAEHTAARFSDQQFLIVVPKEDVSQASRRTEEMRQRVDSTEFVVEGRSIKATVTCALAQLSKDQSGEKLFEFLEEALMEAKRLGGNRTYTHDGNSPSPIVPPDLAVAPQQLAI